MSSGRSPDRRSASRRATSPSASASVCANVPLNAVPIGVRQAETISASVILVLLFRIGSAVVEAQGAVDPDDLAVEVVVLGDLQREAGVLVGAPHPLRVG